VQGGVRRALAAAGLEVAKVPGPPGGKREVLRARRSAPASADGA
jgi:tRNA U34 5-methylaminomethyl-2-thiouridine-forming methyltransferase MnmC